MSDPVSPPVLDKPVSVFDEFDPLASPVAEQKNTAPAPVEADAGASAIDKILEEKRRHDEELAKAAADDAAKRKEAEGERVDIGVSL